MAKDRAKRPEAKALRLFVAIEIPDEAKATVEAAFAGWRAEFPRARWAPAENWHVTVKFLGQTWPRLLGWVQEAVGRAAATCEPFETRLDGVGAFPSPRRARVLWAGLDDAHGRMRALAAALDEELAKEFVPEKRAFTPHLTVARSDPPLGMPDGFAQTALEPVAFAVDHLTLFRSRLRRPAPVYEPLCTWALG
jgi:2'-5' RNA ligase